MSVTPLDSALWSGIFGDPELAALLDDKAHLAAMLRVEVALATACAAAGVIPNAAGAAIENTVAGRVVDPSDLAEATARDGVPVPGLVALLQRDLPAEVAGYLHWGATSQDIMDTATVLQLGPALDVLTARLNAIIARLGQIAGAEAETIMAARTRTQIALPATFGALVAHWGTPLLTARTRFATLRPRLMRLSLHGAVGTDAALGPAAPQVRQHMAAALGLSAADTPWHTDRDTLAELGAALVLMAAALGRIGKDIADLAQSGIAEIQVAGGASSTMPHKSNPVGAEALVTLARHAAHLQGGLFEAAIHGQFRDGAAWPLEWMTLCQIAVVAGASLSNAGTLLASLQPDRARMRANLDAAGFGPYAEAASFALARRMPRGAAKAAVREALETDDPAAELARRFPDVDWAALCDPLTAAGTAPEQARVFAEGAA